MTADFAVDELHLILIALDEKQIRQIEAEEADSSTTGKLILKIAGILADNSAT